MHPAPGMRRTAQGWPQSTPPEKSHPGFAVNKTGDDMKPDTQENTHIPVISSRGKENLYLLIMLNSGYYLHESIHVCNIRVCVILIRGTNEKVIF